MTRWKAILGVCLVFLLGVVFGGVAGAKFMERRFRAAVEGGPDAISSMIVRRLAQELGLQPDQREQVRVIVSEARDRIRTIRHETQPEIESVMIEAQTSVRAILDPRQAEEFDKLVVKARARWKAP